MAKAANAVKKAPDCLRVSETSPSREARKRNVLRSIRAPRVSSARRSLHVYRRAVLSRFLQVVLSHGSRSALPSARGTMTWPRSRSDETEKGRLGGRVKFFFPSSSSFSSLLPNSVLKPITAELKFDTIILFLIWPRHQGPRGLSLTGCRRLLRTSIQICQSVLAVLQERKAQGRGEEIHCIYSICQR